MTEGEGIIVPRAVKNGRSFLRSYATELSLLCALVLLCTVVSIMSPYFLTFKNIALVGVYVSVMGTMAAGLTIAMLLGGIDLSQWAVAAFTGMLIGLLLKAGVNPAVVIVVAIVSGIAAGCVNGFVITTLKINPMIATIGTQLVFRSIAYLITNGAYVQINDPAFKVIGYGRVLGVPILVLIMLLVYALIYLTLRFTVLGRKVYAVGGNASASHLSGVNVNRTRFSGYVISSLTAGIAAVLLTSEIGASLPSAGTGQEMDGIAAVILGGISMSGGKGRIVGTFIGILLLAVLSNSMTLLYVPPYFQIMVKGLVLIVAVYFDTLRGGGYK